MRYWVVDSETTGLDETAKAVEVAGFYCVDGIIQKHYRSFVNPGIPIPVEASAIHHITDEDVADAPSIEEAMLPFFDEEFEFVVAHQAKFDTRFMDFGNCDWLCTWKLGLRVFPESPVHSNQGLRHHLKRPAPTIASAEFAHRALYDAEVTADLFSVILERAQTDDPWPKMLEISSNPALLKKCKLKKHMNTPWKDVPRDYLNWILNKSTGWDEDVLFTARYYYDR